MRSTRGLLAELARRGQGRREAGAFLLTDRSHPTTVLPQPVTAIAYYDDLDPDCLTGSITFHANGYSALNALCRQRGVRAIGDIHTHPGRGVGQSRIDAANPMIALPGHIALIAPRFAIGVTSISELGVHVRGNGTWTSYFDGDTALIIHIRRSRVRWSAGVRRLWAAVRRYATRWLRSVRNS